MTAWCKFVLALTLSSSLFTMDWQQQIDIWNDLASPGQQYVMQWIISQFIIISSHEMLGEHAQAFHAIEQMDQQVTRFIEQKVIVDNSFLVNELGKITSSLAELRKHNVEQACQHAIILQKQIGAPNYELVKVHEQRSEKVQPSPCILY